jgi:hypothetical protein
MTQGGNRNNPFEFQGDADLKFLRDEIYEGKWPAMLIDLLERLGARPAVSKTFDNIRDDLLSIIRLQQEEWKELQPSSGELTDLNLNIVECLGKENITKLLPATHINAIQDFRFRIESLLKKVSPTPKIKEVSPRRITAVRTPSRNASRQLPEPRRSAKPKTDRKKKDAGGR